MASLMLVSACGGVDDETERLERARQAQAAGDLRSAMVDLRVLVQANPELAEARHRLGEVFLALGDAADAETQFRRALSFGWPAEDVLPDLGRALLLLGEHELLLRELRPAGDGPKRADLLIPRGWAYLGLQQVDQAETSFSEAVSLTVEGSEALLGLGEVARLRGNLQQAEHYVMQAMSSAPENHRVWWMLGALRLQQQRYLDAEQAFERGLQTAGEVWLLPMHLPLSAGLIDALLMRGEHGEAFVHAEKLLAEFPNSALAQYQRGRVALELDDLNGAQRHLDLVLKISPDNVPAKILLGSVHRRLGHLSQAEMLLGSAVAAEPENMDARRLLAEVQLALGDPLRARATLGPQLDEADSSSLGLAGVLSVRSGDLTAGIHYLRRSIALEPASAWLQLELANAYLAAHRPDEALDVLEALADERNVSLQRQQLRIVALWQRGDHDAADELLERSLAEHPGSAAAFALAGLLRASAGDGEQARRHFERALEVDETNLSALAGLARLDHRSGDPETAIGRYRKALEREPDNYRLVMALAELQAFQGNLDEAEALLQKAHRLDSRGVQPLLALAGLAMRQGDLAGAAASVDRAFELAPQDARVSMAQASLALARQDVDAAVAVLDEAVERAPGETALRYHLARLLLRQGRTVEARRHAEQVLEAQPAHPGATVLLAELDFHEGRTHSAFAALRRSIDAYPANPLPRIATGDLLMRLQQHTEAADAYDAALELGMSAPLALRAHEARTAAGRPDALAPLEAWLQVRPDEPRVLLAIGQAYEQRSRIADAVGVYERLLELGHANPAVLNNLAWHYHQAGDERALALAEQAYVQGGGTPAVADTLGWILVSHGQYGRAVELLRKAAEATPDSLEIRYHLAAALAGSDRRNEARALLVELLSEPAAFAGRRDAERLLAELGV